MALAEDDSKERVHLFSHAVNREELRPGDHIYVYKGRGVYTHHGIYTGNEGQNEVIQFVKLSLLDPASAVIDGCPLEEFLSGATLRLVAYNVPFIHHVFKRCGSSHTKASKPGKEVVQTATYYLDNPDEWGRYQVCFNNCQHFAVHCKTETDRNITAAIRAKVPSYGIHD